MHHRRFALPHTLLALTLASTLMACGGTAAEAPASTPGGAVGALASEAGLAEAITAKLQACAYDGSPVAINGVSQSLPSDCRDMVAEIMKFTGLPQNFTVVEANVPNAAAVILLDEQRVPKRVIAFNRDFIGIVRNATHGNAWAPISIMAHEIGHHLSGHTITPGGSQPPIELEADKFSGFVLYKMGASLTDAQVAMSELVPDGPDGRTHPGRARRLRAIADGWTQACEQQGGSGCGSGAAVAAPRVASAPAPVAEPVPTAPIDAPQSTPAVAPTLAGNAPAPAEAPVGAATAVDHLPKPGATPSKLDRFIYDEYGVLDATWRARFEKDMFEHARQHGVEIVTLLVKDTHGLSGDAYAWAMLRQLRVGKLDVGNGVVLVVAPDRSEVGIAMGPGVALQMEGHDKKDELKNWLDMAWTLCQRKQACGTWTENFMLAADHIRRDTDQLEWTVRYPSLVALMEAYAAYHKEIDEKGERSDPEADPGYMKIAQIDGEVVAVDVGPDYQGAFVNEISAQNKQAIHVQGDGYTLMLYADPALKDLMPAGALVPGARYRFTARVASLSWNKKDTQAFDLLSYDRLD